MFVMGGGPQNPEQELFETYYGMEFGRKFNTLPSSYCAWEKYLSLPWNWTIGSSDHITTLKPRTHTNRQLGKETTWNMTRTGGGFRTYYDLESGRQMVVFKIKDVLPKVISV